MNHKYFHFSILTQNVKDLTFRCRPQNQRRSIPHHRHHLLGGPQPPLTGHHPLLSCHPFLPPPPSFSFFFTWAPHGFLLSAFNSLPVGFTWSSGNIENFTTFPLSIGSSVVQMILLINCFDPFSLLLIFLTSNAHFELISVGFYFEGIFYILCLILICGYNAWFFDLFRISSIC